MESEPRLVCQATLQEYFQESVTSALTRQSLKADDATVWYLVNLLTGYARSDALFSDTVDGRQLPLLASLYAEAVEAANQREREFALQRLGDIALFISGLYADSLQRRLVDLDYYVAMGAQAYGHLAERSPSGPRSRALAGVFHELGAKFVQFVDVLHDVSEAALRQGRRDWLRVYEVWVRTGSPRAERLLRAAGIEPSAQASLILH
jgi:hypothetical protein